MATMWNDPVFLTLSERYFVQAQDPKTRIEHYDDIYRGRNDIQYDIFPEDWKFAGSA